MKAYGRLESQMEMVGLQVTTEAVRSGALFGAPVELRLPVVPTHYNVYPLPGRVVVRRLSACGGRAHLPPQGMKRRGYAAFRQITLDSCFTRAAAAWRAI